MTNQPQKSTEEQLFSVYVGLKRAQLAEKIALLEAMQERFGPEALEVAEEVFASRMREIWAGIAEREGNSIDDLIRVLWDSCPELFEYTIEQVDGETRMRVTRCEFYEMAKEMDVTDWGFRLFCADDPPIVAGFNPKMGFRRTKTLMEGCDCCDHCYFMKAD